MQALAIVNPISGRRNVARLVEAVGRELASKGCRLDIAATAGPHDARRIAASAAGSARAVIAVGGDGTVHEVAAGLVGRETPLAVLPAGTENIVARHFGVSRKPARFAEMIVGGATARLDVGRANGEPFIIMCGVGFDARVVERLSQARRGHIGYVHYVRPLWRTFWDDPFSRMEIRVDGDAVFDGRGMAFVGVQPRYSLGLHILARSAHDDGRIDLCVYPCEDRWTLMAHTARTVFGRHIARGGVVYRKCRTVEISSTERVPVQCDGDPAGTLPVRFDVMPGALRLIVPGRNQHSKFKSQ